MLINAVNSHPTVKFAADELDRYLDRMWEYASFREGREPEIRLGLFCDFNLTYGGDDPEYDDEIYVSVGADGGVISGVNPRSVLLAVYRYLTELGCAWTGPGEEGEFIPSVDFLEKSVHISERPSYRYRGVCIEGAVSLENVIDMIALIPKLGFNSYFIQFREAFTFFDRWYGHKSNPVLEPENFTVEMAQELVGKISGEIVKRSLLYHAVGHGWTCEPFGIKGLGWDAEYIVLPKEKEGYFALVNGKREIFGGVPLNTNICFSNSDARRIIVEDVVKYCTDNPQVDIVHFWMSDGTNNQCECDNCRGTLPSDFYIMLLNEIDEALTEKGITTKLVFLIYVDLMWAPKVNTFKNSNRFILMFAPITRTYSRSFDTDEEIPEIPEFKLNKLVFPSSVEENVAFLKKWQEVFNNGKESFDFDYHYMWAHFTDPGQAVITRTLYEDIRNLKKLGLNGYISCQVQRSFYPHGLGMYIMGRTLWDSSVDYNKVADEFYVRAYGVDGPLCRNYMERISKCFDMEFIYGRKELSYEEVLSRHTELSLACKEFMPVIEKNCRLPGNNTRSSWEYLIYHAKITQYLSECLLRISGKNYGQALETWEECRRYVCENELHMQKIFDVFTFILTVNEKMKALCI